MTGHLTNPYDEETTRRINETPPGMAAWAGGGPDGMTCRECVYYEGDGYYSASRKTLANSLKPARCERHRQLMGGKKGAKFRYSAKACRFFIEDFDPMPATASINLS